jgi:hypothetical protein
LASYKFEEILSRQKSYCENFRISAFLHDSLCRNGHIDGKSHAELVSASYKVTRLWTKFTVTKAVGEEVILIKGLIIILTLIIKSPLTSLCQREELPLFSPRCRVGAAGEKEGRGEILLKMSFLF